MSWYDDLLQRIGTLQRQVNALPTAVTYANRLALDDDVRFDTLADGDVPTWDATIKKFVNQAGGAGFPITFDDGTYTYTIDVISGALRLRTITDAGSVLNEDLQLSPTGVTLDDSTVNGITFNTGGGGMFGNDGGFFVVDSGGGVSIQSTTSTTYSSDTTMGINGGRWIRLNAPETIFQGATAAPTSGDLGVGEFALWFDPVAHTLNVKGRDSGSTIRNLVIGTLT